MSECKFVRKAKEGWEYGHMKITDMYMPSEKREYVVAGTANGYEEALTLNSMALNDTRSHKRHIPPTFRD